MATRFYVEITPDGDAPESPTVHDVEDLIEHSGGPESVVKDWNLQVDTTFVKVG